MSLLGLNSWFACPLHLTIHSLDLAKATFSQIHLTSMANTVANSDFLVNITVHLSSNNGGPESVLFFRKVQGVTKTWGFQFGNLDNATPSDTPPLIIKDDPPSDRTQIEVHVCAAPLVDMVMLLLMLHLLLLVLLLPAVFSWFGAYKYLVGALSLGIAVTMSLLALLVTLQWAWDLWQYVSLEISNSIMIPQASPSDEDPATTLAEDMPAPQRSSQPTDIYEAGSVSSEDALNSSPSSEPDMRVEVVRDLLNRFTACMEKFQLLEQNHLDMFGTHLDDGEVDATRPVTPDVTEDSSTNTVPQFGSGSSRSTSPTIETPDSSESNSALVDSSPAKITIIDSHLNDSDQTPASPSPEQEGQQKQPEDAHLAPQPTPQETALEMQPVEGDVLEGSDQPAASRMTLSG